jgi:hypothetical protein
LPRRDGARNAADLRNRSTATNWHDGQISRWRENAVEEIFPVTCERRRGNVNAVILVERERRIVMAGLGLAWPGHPRLYLTHKKVSRKKSKTWITATSAVMTALIRTQGWVAPRKPI